MQFELTVDDEEIVEKYKAKILTRLQGVLTVMVTDLQAEERQRTAFIRHGMDGAAAIESANLLERRRAEHLKTFGTMEGFRA